MGQKTGFILLSVMWGTLAFAEDPELLGWESALEGIDLNRMERASNYDPVRERISDVVFDAINSVTLASFDFGRSNISLSVSRKVYDNFGDGTWSVVDAIDLDGKLPIFSTVIEELGKTGKFGFGIG